MLYRKNEDGTIDEYENVDRVERHFTPEEFSQYKAKLEKEIVDFEETKESELLSKQAILT